jgi:hypothetical protein
MHTRRWRCLRDSNILRSGWRPIIAGRANVPWIRRLNHSYHALRGSPAARLAYGIALADDGMHIDAVDQFHRAAGTLPDAAFRLGRCYLLGLGVPAGPDAALHWFTRAACGGHVDAQVLLASLALQGISSDVPLGLFEATTHYIGRPPDYQAALHWAREAAATGSAEAQTLLGYILTAGPEALRDARQGAANYRLAAEQGSAQGQLGWALALLRDDAGAPDTGAPDAGAPDASVPDAGAPDAANAGSGNPDNRQPGAASRDPRAQAYEMLTAAAAAGLPTAHYILGTLAESAPPGDDQLAVAAEHYRTGAELGHPPSEVRYGLALLNGRGVKRDTLNGETWLRRAGLAGDVQAAALVGDLYAHPSDLAPNFCEAALWFERAAQAGHPGAARALGQLCLRGGGFGTDPVAAVRWLRVAADAGDAVAAHDLAICLVHAIGTPCDDAEAVHWFRFAIDTMPAARYWYGRMLAEGRGVAADQTAARACYLEAAAEGNDDAAIAAGEMLVNGRGGPADRPAAMRLFNDAAARGHQGARYALRVLAAESAAPAVAPVRDAPVPDLSVRDVAVPDAPVPDVSVPVPDVAVRDVAVRDVAAMDEVGS